MHCFFMWPHRVRFISSQWIKLTYVHHHNVVKPAVGVSGLVVSVCVFNSPPLPCQPIIVLWFFCSTNTLENFLRNYTLILLGDYPHSHIVQFKKIQNIVQMIKDGPRSYFSFTYIFSQRRYTRAHQAIDAIVNFQTPRICSFVGGLTARMILTVNVGSAAPDLWDIRTLGESPTLHNVFQMSCIALVAEYHSLTLTWSTVVLGTDCLASFFTHKWWWSKIVAGRVKSRQRRKTGTSVTAKRGLFGTPRIVSSSSEWMVANVWMEFNVW